MASLLASVSNATAAPVGIRQARQAAPLASLLARELWLWQGFCYAAVAIAYSDFAFFASVMGARATSVPNSQCRNRLVSCCHRRRWQVRSIATPSHRRPDFVLLRKGLATHRGWEASVSLTAVAVGGHLLR